MLTVTLNSIHLGYVPKLFTVNVVEKLQLPAKMVGGNGSSCLSYKGYDLIYILVSVDFSVNYKQDHIP